VAAIDDLKNAVANLGTSMSNELSAILAKLSNPGTGDADIEDLVTQIDNLKTTVDQETATRQEVPRRARPPLNQPAKPDAGNKR
jgi:hypothetical protein